jgi:hypothetical protein
MAAIPLAEVQSRIAASPLHERYATPIDRDSAHEIISARIEAAKAAAVGAAAGAASGEPLSPAAERKAIEARAKELERIRREAERQAKAQAKAEAAAARERERTIREAMKAGSRVATSRAGQDLLRGVLGTLFGGGRKR